MAKGGCEIGGFYVHELASEDGVDWLVKGDVEMPKVDDAPYQGMAGTGAEQGAPTGG
jgi:hypothetical protein